MRDANSLRVEWGRPKKVTESQSGRKKGNFVHLMTKVDDGRGLLSSR